MIGKFYCRRCQQYYELEYLTKDEVQELRRAGFNSTPLRCPIGHLDIVLT